MILAWRPRNGPLLALLLALGAAAGCGQSSSARSQADAPIELLNVSNDPTRELWREMSDRFSAHYQQETGRPVSIVQSHGSSVSQARAVIDGLEADVVTLALWPDTNAIEKAGLIEEGWEDRFPNDSSPYYTLIVFVVRKGNPKGIRDWPDLIKPGVEIVTPTPKTSGNGKLSFLAAWGSVLQAGGAEEQARAFVTQLYRQAPVLDAGARGATATFSQKGIGDVHLTFEAEARLEIEESGGALEIIYPPRTIRGDPPIAVVDANAKRHGTTEIADAYLRYIFSEPGQETIAKHHYRPFDAAVLARHGAQFPEVELFGVEALAGTWAEIQEKFFQEGALFDQIFSDRQP